MHSNDGIFKIYDVASQSHEFSRVNRVCVTDMERGANVCNECILSKNPFNYSMAYEEDHA